MIGIGRNSGKRLTVRMMSNTHFQDATARMVRILSLLDALAAAGLTPSSNRALHELAYLANVLAPVFDLTSLDAVLLKRKSGPYYPELQQTIDSLVGRGLVEALEPRYEMDEIEQRYRMIVSYRLRRSAVTPALDRYRVLYESEAHFLDELSAAYSALTDEEQGYAALRDARYADASVDVDNVIDFGQWVDMKENFSRNAAMAFAPDENLLPAERLYMYLDYLQQKVVHG